MELGHILTALALLGSAPPHAHGAVSATAEAAAEVPDLATRHDGDDWPTYLGPHGQPVSAENGIRTDWGRGGPPLVWQTAMGTGYAGVSIARGRAFLFDRIGDQVRLRALRAESGEELWRTTFPTRYEDGFGYANGPRATPVVDGDRVYTHGVDGWLRCQRVVDGGLLWEHDLASEYHVVTNFFGAASTPLVVDDLLIVPVGGSPPGTWDIHAGRVRANGTGLVAFDKRGGKERWHAVDELASYSSPILADFGGRRRGVWLARGGLVIFDPGTGAEDLRFPFRARKVYSVNASTPVIVGDRILLSESYELGGALLQLGANLETAEVVWRDPPRRGQALAAHWMTPAYRDGFVYGSSGEKSGNAELHCVEWETGRIRWSQPGLNRATVLLVDGHLVVLTEMGQLLLVAAIPESYRELASVVITGEVDGEERPLLRHPAWSAPVLSHGLLYLRGGDRMIALELIPRPRE